MIPKLSKHKPHCGQRICKKDPQEENKQTLFPSILFQHTYCSTSSEGLGFNTWAEKTPNPMVDFIMDRLVFRPFQDEELTLQMIHVQ
jgi:hypothetical protein